MLDSHTNIVFFSWGCLGVFLYYLPKPQRPSGMAFSWIGEGLSKPHELRPFKTSGESSNDLKSTSSSVNTSPVRCLSLIL